MRRYEAQTNTHVFDNVAPLIADDATYWFSEGEFKGKESIRGAFERTWAAIQDETYSLHHLKWLIVCEDAAVCIYSFKWKGNVNGVEKSGSGRGTNVFQKTPEGWKVIHEHLSS